MLVALVRRNCAAATPCSRALKSALFHSSAPSCLASKRQPGGGGGGGGGSQQSIQRLSPNPPPRAQQKPSSSKSSSSSPSPSSSTKNPWLDSLESLVKLVRVFVESETLHKRCKTLRLSPALVEETKESFIGAVAQGNLISHQDLAVRFKSGEDIERILLAEFFNHAADVSKMMAETEVASNSSSSSSTATSDILTILTDSSSLKNPAAWFKETRLMKRKIIMHVGPTNSGKTYNALQSLGTAASGIYCGPLRLLAHEIYERFNASGVRCNLITGEDRREMEGVDLYACTVEMALLHKQFDVAVIDEIQMISDSSRGWAWTQAFLGIIKDTGGRIFKQFL